MPIVSLRYDELCDRLGQKFTEDEFQQLCFDFGVELDEVMTVAEAEGKHTGDPAVDDAVVYKVEIGANRYDLLCIEGITRAMNIFRGKEPPPMYRTSAPPAMLTMTVKPATAAIRPFVVCAVLRNITFTPEMYRSFIKLQEKLHQNVCRRRTLVAIGTHDLDTIEPPFTYEALPPKEINFVPLTQSREFDGASLMEFYRTDESVTHIKPYVDIIYDSPVYPVIYDAKRTVLSLPPIINGDHSKIDPAGATKNVFIECTGTDLTKANIVLNTMVTMFAEHCADKFVVEPVRVEYEDGSTPSYVTPDLSSRTVRASMKEINAMLATELAPEVAVNNCVRMQVPAVYDAETDEVVAEVPPTRSDILHAVDIIEDIALAYGFNNIIKRMPAVRTVGRQLPINHLTDLMRLEIAQAGYTECLTMALCSHADCFEHMRMDEASSEHKPVVLANPKARDFQIARTTLIPGLLKCVASNKSAKMSAGLKFFEISDIVMLDDSTDVGARNQRNMAAAFCSVSGGFEVIHGLVDRVMRLNGVRPAEPALERDAGYEPAPGPVPRYKLVPSSEHPFFLDPFGADIVLIPADGGGGDAAVVGHFGMVHPEVLKSFELVRPVSVMELNLERFL